jgi:hypothetical protein
MATTVIPRRVNQSSTSAWLVAMAEALEALLRVAEIDGKAHAGFCDGGEEVTSVPCRTSERHGIRRFPTSMNGLPETWIGLALPRDLGSPADRPAATLP